MRRTKQPPSGGGKERRKHAFRDEMHLDRSYQDPTAAKFSVLLLPVSQPSCTCVSEQLGLFIDLIASRDFAGLFMGTLIPFCHTKAASMRRNTTCYSKEPQLHADLIPLSRDQLDEGGTTMLPQLPFYKHLDNKTCTCSLDQSFRSTSLCMQPLKKIVL